jgi:hypothetical protein
MDILSGESVQPNQLNTIHSKGRSVKCFFLLMFGEAYIILYTDINVLFNWEELTMRLRSNLVLKRIVAWRMPLIKREWFIIKPTCVELWTPRFRPRTGYCCDKQGWWWWEQFIMWWPCMCYTMNSNISKICVLCIRCQKKKYKYLGQF